MISLSHQKNAKIKTYHLTILKYNDRQFKSFFRMSRNAFENLMIFLEPHPVFIKTQAGGEGSFGEFMKIIILRHAL